MNITLAACLHKKLSRVFTPKGGGDSHVVCFSCSQSFQYDLENMRMGHKIEPDRDLRPSEGSRFSYGA